MKYLVCSDIHGSIESAEFIIKKYQELNCDKIICLGDVLYHGPRNDIPENYNPKKVVEVLNEHYSRIVCLKGNCDAEVDEMVLNFRLEKSISGFVNDKICHLEHGHKIKELSTNSNLVFYGHTHIPFIKEVQDVIVVNPGSITIPKDGNKRTYAVWDKHSITIYDMEDNIISHIEY